MISKIRQWIKVAWFMKGELRYYIPETLKHIILLWKTPKNKSPQSS